MIITKKDKKNKSDKISILDRDISGLMDKVLFILRRYFGLILILPWVLFLLIFTKPFNYPAESELVYEECTYIQYEYVYHDNLKGSDSEEYLIYVEEYDEPLHISVGFDKADRTLLSIIETGEKVTVSIEEHFGRPFLYLLACGDNYVLSYNDYLSEHIESDKIIVITCIVFVFIAISFSLIEIIYKKVKGKSLFWKEP